MSTLPACDNCVQHLIQHQEAPTDCHACAAWNYECTNPILHFDPPKDYPVEECMRNGKLKPVKLTFQLLKNVLEKAHDNIMSGDWSLAMAKSYLSVYCIDNATATDIIARSDSCNTLFDAMVANMHDPEVLHELEDERLLDPTMYNMFPFPAMWDRPVALTQHIEVPMHLLFLGVCKNVNLIVMDWLHLRLCLSLFCLSAENTLQLVKAVQLSWCKTCHSRKEH